MRLVAATGNEHKLLEIRRILLGTGIELVATDAGDGWPTWVENGATYYANALIKATAFRDFFALPAVADDSGLEVDFLDGAPGVMSARYSGEEADSRRNNEKLLKALDGVSAGQRGARFRCVALCLFEDGEVVAAEGVCEGAIAAHPHGLEGFGYDPVFVPTGGRMTMAELSAESKDAISHRGRAFRALAELLRIRNRTAGAAS